MDADIRIEDGKLVFGLESCINCMGRGTQYSRMACPLCKGTGRTKGGTGKGECRNCHGFKQVTDFDDNHRITCLGCNGCGKEQATSTSYLPKEIFPSLEFRVVRDGNGMSWNESWLGAGYVYTCTDHGRAHDSTNEQVIEDVRSHSDSVQACKISKDDGTLCEYIAIIVHRDGYSVKAVYHVN